MEGAEWSLKKFFLFTVYNLRCQCHKIHNINILYYIQKKDFVLDKRDCRMAHTSGFNGESCAGDRVQFPCRSNL